MDITTHRTELTKAIGPKVILHPLESSEGLHVYVGLWSVWWVNGTSNHLRILIATIRSRYTNQTPPVTVTLDEVPWLILQMQSIDDRSHNWDRIHSLLREELDFTDTSVHTHQQNLTFNPSQTTAKSLKLQDPDALEHYIVRRADPSATDAGLQNTMQRNRVSYDVLKQEANSQTSQVPMRVILERAVPKHMALGQKIHQEVGFVKESNLLSAFNEWHTWIMFV
jgi:hypothetical protein